MATYAYVNIDIPEAERLLALAGIRIDLISARVCLDRILAEEYADENSLQCLFSNAVVKYGRCFTGGVRFSIRKEELLASLQPDELELHQRFFLIRDKYVAHSVNSMESHRVRVWLEPEERGRGITQINTESNYLARPSHDVLCRVVSIIPKIMVNVDALARVEEAMLRGIVEQRYTMEQLYKLEVTPFLEIDFSKVEEKRKRS